MADWKRFVDAEASSHLQTRLGDAKVFIAVDTSGSAEWDLGGCMNAFESERQFANAVDSNLFASCIALSNYTGTPTLEALVLPQSSRRDQTLQRLLSSDFWCLFTDGEVDDDEVQKLHHAAKRHGALTIPVIILVTGCKPVNEANLSVGMALYANGVDAVFLYKRIGTKHRRTCIYVLHAKGRFAPLRPADSRHNDNAPQFSSESAFWGACTTKAIKVVRAENRFKETPGILMDTATNVAGLTLNVTIDVQKLVVNTNIAQHDLETIPKPRVLNDVALAARTQGNLDDFRKFLDGQRPRNVVVEPRDIYQAGTVISQAAALLRSPGPEQNSDLRKTLREKHHWNRTVYQQDASKQATEALQEAASRNEAIDTALDHLTVVEHSGYGVGIFDLQPSRSQTSTYAHPSNVHISVLDFDAVKYAMQCMMCGEKDALMWLAVKQLDDRTVRTNCSQMGSQNPILYGKRTADQQPFSSQLVCYQCATALMPTSIHHENISAIIPLTQYQGDNKDHIKKAMYAAFTGGIDVGEAQVVQMAMAIIDQTMALSWVRANSTITSAFHWLLVLLQQNSLVPGMLKLGSPLVSFNQALQTLADDCANLGPQSYVARLPAETISVIRSLGSRTGQFTEDTLSRLADANNMFQIIETYLKSKPTQRSSTSRQRQTSWQTPWQKLLAQKTAHDFWHDLRKTVGVKSLHDAYSKSEDNFNRCRAVVSLLLHCSNGVSTADEFLKYLYNLDLLLLKPSAAISQPSVRVAPVQSMAPARQLIATFNATVPLAEKEDHDAEDTDEEHEEERGGPKGKAPMYSRDNHSEGQVTIQDSQVGGDWIWSHEYQRYYRLLADGQCKWDDRSTS
ncbi:hypothetical protein FB567DRAFT_629547 [Paraphoma chrysanthemicola]|uniref:Uncharacterized protein n=1 Tax=Paraphoma chrysanthemicola TaxID=798071 RepID=A0A8K0R4C2_9PLEO|nr:hypothetical protein FB567DRAFT_629547 [Paraphoma chrysanthemicola]